MDSAQRDDFVVQMRLLAFEEAPLWEVPIGSADLLQERSVVHGPWLADDCSRTLAAWCSLGLIGVQRQCPRAQEDLSEAEALDALSQPDRWAADRELSLYVTELGERTAHGQWRVAPDSAG